MGVHQGGLPAGCEFIGWGLPPTEPGLRPVLQPQGKAPAAVFLGGLFPQGSGNVGVQDSVAMHSVLEGILASRSFGEAPKLSLRGCTWTCLFSVWKRTELMEFSLVRFKNAKFTGHSDGAHL